MAEYCKECNSILDNKGGCTNRSCLNYKKVYSKRYKWKIGDSIIEFNKPLTYNEALKNYKNSFIKEKSEFKKIKKHMKFY